MRLPFPRLVTTASWIRTPTLRDQLRIMTGLRTCVRAFIRSCLPGLDDTHVPAVPLRDLTDSVVGWALPPDDKQGFAGINHQVEKWRKCTDGHL